MSDRSTIGGARIVLLNGTGSSGKSSIARALQEVASVPFLHVEMDAFLEMLPETLLDHPDGFSFETERLEDGKPQVVIRPGAVGARTMRGMRHAIAAMAGQRCDLIVDDVLCNGGMPEYEALLAPFAFHRVGVLAPLDLLEARERERGDRMIGLARWQFDRVHSGVDYDFTVDTSVSTPAECAALIKERFGL